MSPTSYPNPNPLCLTVYSGGVLPPLGTRLCPECLRRILDHPPLTPEDGSLDRGTGTSTESFFNLHNSSQGPTGPTGPWCPWDGGRGSVRVYEPDFTEYPSLVESGEPFPTTESGLEVSSSMESRTVLETRRTTYPNTPPDEGVGRMEESVSGRDLETPRVETIGEGSSERSNGKRLR